MDSLMEYLDEVEGKKKKDTPVTTGESTTDTSEAVNTPAPNSALADNLESDDEGTQIEETGGQTEETGTQTEETGGQTEETGTQTEETAKEETPAQDKTETEKKQEHEVDAILDKEKTGAETDKAEIKKEEQEEKAEEGKSEEAKVEDIKKAIEKNPGGVASEATDADKGAKPAGDTKASPMIQIFSNKFSFEGLSKLFGGGAKTEGSEEKAAETKTEEKPGEKPEEKKEEEKPKSFKEKMLDKLSSFGESLGNKLFKKVEDRYTGDKGFDNIKKDLKTAGKAVVKGAKKVGSAIKKGATALGRGIKNTYRKVRYGSKKAEEMKKQDIIDSIKEKEKKNAEKVKSKKDVRGMEHFKKNMENGGLKKQEERKKKKEAAEEKNDDAMEGLGALFGDEEEEAQEEPKQEAGEAAAEEVSDAEEDHAEEAPVEEENKEDADPEKAKREKALNSLFGSPEKRKESEKIVAMKRAKVALLERRIGTYERIKKIGNPQQQREAQAQIDEFKKQIKEIGIKK